MYQSSPILKLDVTRTAHRAERRREQNRLNQSARRLRKRIQNAKKEDKIIGDKLRNSPFGVLVPSSSGAWTDQPTAAVLLYSQIPNYIILTQLNVWQATLINSLLLGISHFFIDGGVDAGDNSNSTLNDGEDLSYLPHYLSPSSPLLQSSKRAIPPSLTPTPLQKTIPHYPWIDLIPLAGLRDSLIRAGSRIEVHEFCMDMMGDMFNSLSENSSTISQGGFLVWGDSWEIESWEMTDGFVQKWGWLLDEGCEEIVRATNRWREGRGQNTIVFQP